MSETEWVDAFMGASIADEAYMARLELGIVDVSQNGRQPVHIVTLEQFVSVSEETADPLLGTAQATILPRSGRLLMYGDGGAGKTTLSIDAAAHMASGTDWIGVTIEKPLKVLIIENEGPRGKFRERLGQKIETWQGEAFRENVFVLEEPWTRFTFEDEDHRQRVANFCSTLEVDVVIVGPLATIGMIGGGTPDEVNNFTDLLDDLAHRSTRAFAVWIVHHENKAGDVSGAWERVPDTLVHIQARGNGHTSLTWEKSRWSDEHHKTSVDLIWGEGRSFHVLEEAERDYYAEMLVAFAKDDMWRTAKESGKLISLAEEQAKKVLAELVRRGDMVFEKGPHGRSPLAQCWRLSTALERLAQSSAVEVNHPQEDELRYCAPPVRGAVSSSAVSPESATAPKDVSAVGEVDDDGIPF